MLDPSAIQATPLSAALLGLLGKLVWPVFLWFLLRRQDVHEYIRTVLKILERMSKVKGYGIEATFADGTVRSLPTEERELVIDVPSPVGRPRVVNRKRKREAE